MLSFCPDSGNNGKRGRGRSPGSRREAEGSVYRFESDKREAHELKKIILVILGLLFTSTAGYSVQNESIDVVVDKIQKKYEGIEDFHADFTQEATVKALNTVQKSDGED